MSSECGVSLSLRRWPSKRESVRLFRSAQASVVSVHELLERSTPFNLKLDLMALGIADLYLNGREYVRRGFVAQDCALPYSCTVSRTVRTVTVQPSYTMVAPPVRIHGGSFILAQPNGPGWKPLISYSSDLHELTHMQFTVGLHSGSFSSLINIFSDCIKTVISFTPLSEQSSAVPR